MKQIVPSTPFSNGMSYEFFLESFCYRCKKHKENEDGFCAFVEQGGCPIENAMEDARFGHPFPSNDIVQLIEDGKTLYWHICKAFETDNNKVMKAYQALLAESLAEKGGE